MAGAPLELAGGYKKTTQGTTDWYYDNDGNGWPNLAAAKAGVPSGIRLRRTVLIDGLGEYWWKDGTADGDLVAKTSGSSTGTGSGDNSGIEYLQATNSIHATNWNGAADSTGSGSLNLAKNSKTYAPNSATIGGVNNNIPADHENTVVIGCNSLTTTRKDTTYVNNLQVVGNIYDRNGNLFGGITPPAPSGFSWVTAPATEIAGDDVNVTSSTSLVDGTQKTAAAISFRDLETPPQGYLEPNIVVLNYNATPQVYEIVHGEVVAENDSYIFPAVPANRVMVAPFILRSTGAVLVPSGAVTSISINGGTAQLPNANGELALTVPIGGNVNTVNGQTPDGSKNVLIEAQHIDYTPADTSWFGAATLKVKAALDAIATKIGLLSSLNTTNKTSLVAAINEVKSLVAGGTDAVTLYFTPETSPQEFIVYGKFLSATLQAFDGSTAGNYSFKWKNDGGTYSSSISTISALTTALSGLTDTSKTKIEVTSAATNASSVYIKWSK